VLQQTPSTQFPDPQGVPLTGHACPSVNVHVPMCAGSLQTAPDGQLALPQQTPLTQAPEAHESFAPGAHVDPMASLAVQCFVASQYEPV
jgi:hypothetical protein